MKKILMTKKKIERLPMDYCSPRWSGELTDCSMPMTFDQYDHCSYNCLYCFSFFQKGLKSFNPLFNLRGTSYQTTKLRSVNPGIVCKMFSGIETTTQKKQFADYIRQRITFQWGGLCDPFDLYEKRYGVGFEILRHLSKLHYPICFSTKSTWWTEDDRYLELFKGEKNWNTKFSIINMDESVAYAIEKGVPDPATRLLAMRKISRICPGGVTLRLRPFIIGMSDIDNQYIELIRKAKENGATAVSTEFFCLEDRAHQQTLARYKEMSDVLGFDIRQYYKLRSPGMSGYLRLNWKTKEPYFKKMRDLTHKLGMRFYVSDAHWKDLCDGGSCCGLPESWTYHKGQYTYLLQLAKQRKDHRVYWSDMENLDMYKTILYRYCEGFNTVGSRARTRRWNDNMYDYLLSIWNDPNKAKSPYKYFAGLFHPVGRDNDQNVIYEYKPYK